VEVTNNGKEEKSKEKNQEDCKEEKEKIA
jgi:hypothetical protein